VKFADAIIAALFLIFGFAIGSSYVGAARRASVLPETPGFNQRVFGAALMTACGRGVTTPVVPMVAAESTPAGDRPLIDFLAERRESLSCAEIPDDVPVDGLDGMQQASRYLLLLATTAWKLTGPTWVGIDRLLGLMCGLSIALAYLICRVTMPRVVAASVAILLLISPLHLANVPDLRDYSKAPFFLVSLLVVALIVVRPRRTAVVIGLSAAAGAALGFGFGVRTDIVVNLVVVLVAVVGFLPGPLAETWKVRLASALVCLLAFTAVAWPIFNSRESGSNLWHWALLGYAHDWDNALGVAPGPYEPSYFYSDSYVATAVDAYWSRVTHSPVHMSVGVPQYAEASRGYYSQILRTFPSDALLRGWASVIKILELPYSGLQSIPRGVLPDLLWRAIAMTQAVLVRGGGLGVVLFAVVVLCVSARSIRLATLIVGLVALLGAYPAIQFQRRHIFHLEFLSLWVLGFAVSSVLAAMSRRATAHPVATYSPLASGVWRPVVFAAAVVTLVLLPLTVLRAYQQGKATSLLATYNDARIDAIDMAPEPIGNGLVRVASDRASLDRSRSPRSMFSDMLVAEVSSNGCPVDRSSLTFRYRAKTPSVDFTRTYDVDVPPTGQSTKVYFPVYETGPASPDSESLSFGGVEVPASELGCLKRVSRFSEPDGFPLLVPAVLPSDWRQMPLHQTLRGWERDPLHDENRPLSYWAPIALRNRGAAIIARSLSAQSGMNAEVDYHARIARVGDDASVTVNGVAEGTGSYLVAWKNQPLAAESVVMAEGRLEKGGFTVGLVNSTGWVSRLDVDAPGAFRAFVQPPGAGQYQFVVANHLSDGSLRVRLTISRIAVMNGEHD
jgi:hypothetical protein